MPVKTQLVHGFALGRFVDRMLFLGCLFPAIGSRIAAASSIQAGEE